MALLPLLLAAALACAGAAAPAELCESGCLEEGDEQGLLQVHGSPHRSLPTSTWGRGNAVDVFVMLSLTTVDPSTGRLATPLKLAAELAKIQQTGAAGVMVDVWWGLTEAEPQKYDFSAYRELVEIVKKLHLKIQFVTSFHQCGDESNPETYIPLPAWLTKESGIWFKNALGHETKAYISLFADHVQVGDRTPVQMYNDWMRAMEEEFSRDISDGTVVEIMVGLGTDGELKYPSYENGPWTWPGVGMFQAFDQHALASLQRAAYLAGKPESWGTPPGVNETGDSNAWPENTTFFSKKHLGWQSEKAKFFLNWYSNALKTHAATILPLARGIFKHKVRLSGKIAGVHWWYKHPSHAAELNAGYYNANGVDGYYEIAQLLRISGNVAMDFTCLEMTDGSQPPAYDCGPQELVIQAQRAAERGGVAFTGENALSFYDLGGYQQMVSYKPPTGYLESVTYLRLSDQMLEQKNLETFARFVSSMSHKGVVSPWTV